MKRPYRIEWWIAKIVPRKDGDHDMWENVKSEKQGLAMLRNGGRYGPTSSGEKTFCLIKLAFTRMG
jgi:hypothetical protein